MTRKGGTILRILQWLYAALALATAFQAASQPFPSQPVRLIVPFSPGGSVDITARLIAEPLGRRLGTSVVIDHRSGASGNIGMESAARAKPDGYTVVMNAVSLVTNQSLFDKPTWDPIRDFKAIGMVATSPHVLAVSVKLPVRTVEELVQLARANPGKLSYGSAGIGTTFHLCAEIFKDSANVHILHVPYRGGGPALLDTLAGQVDMSFPTLAAALPYVKAGTLRVLAVTDARRSPLLPDVPTMQEAGVKDFQFTPWLALLAPAATPPAVVTRLNSALNSVLDSGEIRDKFRESAIDAFITTPEEADEFIAREAQRFSRLIKTLRITAG